MLWFCSVAVVDIDLVLRVDGDAADDWQGGKREGDGDVTGASGAELAQHSAKARRDGVGDHGSARKTKDRSRTVDRKI